MSAGTAPASLEDRVQAFAAGGGVPLNGLVALVAAIRPRRSTNAEAATRTLRALCHLLNSRAELRGSFRSALLSYLGSRRGTSLYVDAGLYPNRGFFDETYRRLTRTILPEDADEAYLRDVVGLAFGQASDARWINGIDDAVWQELFAALALHELGEDAGRRWMEDLVEALRVLSYRISAIGLEPELLRIEPTLEAYESPFLGQNVEALALVASWQAWLAGLAGTPDDGQHLHVLFEQGRKVVDRVRARAAREGTSLSLTLYLKRLLQHMERAELILDILDAWATRRRIDDAAAPIVFFCKLLTVEECRKNDLKAFWQDSGELLSRRVTENAGRTGEHYITETRAEYFAMFRSAALAGAVIALMALHKLYIAKAGLAPLNEMVATCLNYGLGFVVIHILHGTVATKQPAMTAAAIAAAIGDGGERSARARADAMERLSGLIARTTRSQLVAILGNVIVAVPVAIGLGWLVTQAVGAPYPAPAKAHQLMADVHPWQSGALFFAAIAGVCLFLSGLISGYYDNLAAYSRIPQRLKRVPWLRRLLGEPRLNRAADYVGRNLGALAGNFFFGCLLGAATAFGMLFGLPIDIRHVAFSSAFLGYSTNAFDFAPGTREMTIAAIGVALIGLTNLLVSFSLSLWVACRSRGITWSQALPLAGHVGKLLRTRPREFFLPPGKPRKPGKPAAP